MTVRCRQGVLAFLLALLFPCLSLPAEDALPRSAGVDFFEKKIRPVLVKHCYSCHSQQAKEPKGGLLLDTRAGIRKGGETGPAVVPGNVQKSLLISALRYDMFEMPPENKLPKEVIADFVKWIRMGAPDPRGGQSGDSSNSAPKYQPISPDKLWSLQPLRNPAPPQVHNAAWPANDIDRFILAKLEANGLHPVGDASPETWLRRVSFDLIGLPPSPAEQTAFLNDWKKSPQQARETVVDRLLSSPQFGERWGRHWLDVARYAESNGKSRDVLMPHAWRYRDYVIDAFNADLPYDRFITEQIAGDLLPADSVAQRDRQRIATGFLAVGSKTLVGATQQMDLIDEQIDTVGKAVLGLTTGCARCHDHKFDPIPTRDYYALAGIFLSTETLFGGGLRRPKDPTGKTRVLMVLGPDAEKRVSEIRRQQQEVSRLTKQMQLLSRRQKRAQKNLPKDWQARLKKLRASGVLRSPAGPSHRKTAGKAAAMSPPDRQVMEYALILDELRSARSRLAELKQSKGPPLEFAVGVQERKTPSDCPLYVRGELKNRGKPVPRGFLSCLSFPESPAVNRQQSGRLELARWLTHPRNPLTPRVAVNRIWLHLFGRGLVRTVDNFGATGEKPTHPELLDYLASRFIRNGWSTKKLIREIVLSRTYLLSTQFDRSNYEADPDNRFYWRMRRRRLEAEAIRDAMLAVSGRLNLTRPKGSPVARIGDGEVGRGMNTRPLEEPFPYRSVYLPIIRGIVPPMLKLFDFPEPSNVQGERAVTNVPAQSLFLMNNPFVTEQARGMAARILQSESDEDKRIILAFRLCFARQPQPEEMEKVLLFLRQSQKREGINGKEAEGNSGKETEELWTTLCQALLASAEFRFLD